MVRYCKRLIEVDLPIRRISAHARREKSIRHGHISTLHIWWARRPLAACRAVICASLWPDPADDLCPDAFRHVARKQMTKWAKRHLQLLSGDSYPRFIAISKGDRNLNDHVQLREALLDFIADFANWDNSTVPEYLETSRALTRAAHEALGGSPDSRPLVLDPFAGGGSIPLEALRVGCDVLASDLNPVAVLLNKILLEYIPKHGQRLTDAVRKLAKWVRDEAESQLRDFYPRDPNGATPIAYLWARVIRCEGPGCGAEIPLMRSLWLKKKGSKPVALKIVPSHSTKGVRFEIVHNARGSGFDIGTIKRGAATCPLCGYVTPVSSIRSQLKERRGGIRDPRLIAVVTTCQSEKGRFYRLATKHDMQAISRATKELERKERIHTGDPSLVPDEEFTGIEPRRIPLPLYGITGFRDLFTNRQLLCLVTLSRLLRDIASGPEDVNDPDLGQAIRTCISLSISRMADGNSSLTRWQPTGEKISNTFGRQALPMVWDFAEANPFCDATRSLKSMFEWIVKVCEKGQSFTHSGDVLRASADAQALPDDSVDAVITDPPYYFSVPYSDLSDFFYVWLFRVLHDVHPDLFTTRLTPKEDECVQNLPHSEVAHLQKSRRFYEDKMKAALAECRRVAKPSAIAVVVFAHTETAAWESLLAALIDAGWCVTASWPIDTEMATRMLAIRQSTLTSSVHLVCRPRENRDGSLGPDNIGDWRDILSELPRRIHQWMPRLAEEGVVGADAIFACLGPAIEIYSRYSSVEKASGEKVALQKYLQEVWAAVSREALSMIFEGADASGFEEDARLTAMWLWTQHTSASGDGEVEAEAPTKTKSLRGYSLEFDAARKIAQGLGANLEKLVHLVEVKGNTATLLSAGARTKYLFGKETTEASRSRRTKKKQQMTLDFGQEIDELDEKGEDWAGEFSGRLGATVLDQLHQSMILFAAGRSAAMKRFLVEEGVGRNPLFWRLAQALSALYPAGTEEKRWVDGVLGRKKGLGF